MPETEIKIAECNDESLWDRYVVSHRQGGPYLVTAWKQAVEAAYNHKTIYLAAYRGGAITGVLPLVIISPPLFTKRIVSLPFCDYGGILADQPEEAGGLLGHAVGIAERQNAALEIRSVSSLPAVKRHPGFIQVTQKHRLVLELPASADLLWGGFKSKLRSQIKKPVREGLWARLGSKDLVGDFYRVFSQNMRDLGSPVHSAGWLESVLSAYGGKAGTAVVYKGSLPVGAGMILQHGTGVTIPWASTLREYNRFSPNMLLYWTFLKYAADSGYQYFDFGRSSPGEGTYSFKQQWGAKAFPLYWYRLDRGKAAAGRPDDNGKGSFRAAVENLWRRMPLSVANAAGPHLRKYIDR